MDILYAGTSVSLMRNNLSLLHEPKQKSLYLEHKRSIEPEIEIRSHDSYTYPATVPAAQHKYKVSPGKYDCCMFVELSGNGEVELSYRFGEYMFRFMEEQQGSYFKTKDMEERTVRMPIIEFRNLFLIP